MNDAFMLNYLNKNIYKVSNPPGGQSSIKLAWDDTLDKFPLSKSFKNQSTRREQLQNNKSSVYENKSISFENKSMIYGDDKSAPFNKNQFPYDLQSNRLRDNMSFVEGTNTYEGNRNSYRQKNYPAKYNSETNNKNSYEHPIQSKNSSSPFSYSKKGYAQYMSPNFIEPRRNEFPSNDFSVQNWENSSRLLEEELKYYQEKNRLLKEKVYGGYNNEETLRKFEPDFHDRIRRIPNQPEELQLAIRQREKNMAYQTPLDIRNKNLQVNRHMFQSINQLINGNGSMLMENQTPVKTSVKVHGPPGGYSSIKFG